MRFVAQNPRYGAQIRPQRQRALGDGGIEILTPGLYVTFRSVVSDAAMLYENERRHALDHFRFSGNTQDMGEAVPTDPINRLAVFDTDEAAISEHWTPEEKHMVEQRLIEIAQTTPNELLLVQDKPVGPPTPVFDGWDGDPAQLVARLIEDGFDMEEVLHYEVNFGNNRPAVVEALEYAVALAKEEVVIA
jgi:hypothetical protein